ncbi:MAG: sigma-70 family RNA polymerase sigma factor [Candidatus Omnitrophota bacterium]|nr:sigma-70 family RNA polymerase sigma factor [Candidatus Omnitrophota bacterium]
MQDEDQNVVERIRAGDKEAYALLVRKHQARIRQLCLWTLGNAAEADDAAQEVFIKAYRGLGGFRGAAGFSTWLHRIAVNHCRDLLRKRGRQPTESWDALREEKGEAAEALVVREDPVIQRRQLQEVLDRLPEQVRTILILREVEGLSYEELAEFLGCSLDAVKARLRRARAECAEKARHFLQPADV